jgi:hypothetical protein
MSVLGGVPGAAVSFIVEALNERLLAALDPNESPPLLLAIRVVPNVAVLVSFGRAFPSRHRGITFEVEKRTGRVRYLPSDLPRVRKVRQKCSKVK